MEPLLMHALTEKTMRADIALRWVGFIEWVEPAAGGDIGSPDMKLLVDRFLRPVELKRGVFRRGRVLPDRVRPSQVSWHRRFQEAGGRSFFLIGIFDDDHIIYFAADSEAMLANRMDGLILNTHCFLVPTSKTAKHGDHVFTQQLSTFVR